MLHSYCQGLVFADSYLSNSVLPYCPTLLVFQIYSLLLLYFGQINDIR